MPGWDMTLAPAVANLKGAAVYSHLIGQYSLRKQGRGYCSFDTGPKAGAV
jgi:hypothetical protein